MSKLYEKYLKLKSVDKDKIYLFKSGIFYVALEEDAKLLNEKCNLKLTSLNDKVDKCGFPVKSLEKWEKLFKSLTINYEIVKELDKDVIIKSLEKVDIENITPVEALNILEKLKGLL